MSCLSFISTDAIYQDVIIPKGIHFEVHLESGGDGFVAVGNHYQGPRCHTYCFYFQGLDSLMDFTMNVAESIIEADWIDLSGDACWILGEYLFNIKKLRTLFNQYDRGLTAWLIASYVYDFTGVSLAPGFENKRLDDLAEEWWASFGKEAE